MFTRVCSAASSPDCISASSRHEDWQGFRNKVPLAGRLNTTENYSVAIREAGQPRPRVPAVPRRALPAQALAGRRHIRSLPPSSLRVCVFRGQPPPRVCSPHEDPGQQSGAHPTDPIVAWSSAKTLFPSVTVAGPGGWNSDVSPGDTMLPSSLASNSRRRTEQSCPADLQPAARSEWPL